METFRTINVATAFGDPLDHRSSSASQTDSLPVYQIVAIVRRHLMLIALSALLGAATTYIAALHLQRFTSKALILIEPHQKHLESSESGVLPSDEQTVIETHIMTLTSSAYLGSIVKALTADHAVDPAKFTELRLERNLKVEQQLHSRVISVTFTSGSAREAAVVANRVADLYVKRLKRRNLDNIESQRAMAQARITALQEELATAADGRRMPQDVDVPDLQRQLSEWKIIESGLERQSSASRYQPSDDSGVSILSPAVPPLRPSTGAPGLLAVPAGVAFAIIGIFAAIVIERADQTLRSTQDVERALGVPCFGVTPWIRGSSDSGVLLRRWVKKSPVDPFSEATRCLLLDHLIGGKSPIVALITSPLPREGKSALAFALADGAARLGRKTLLVDVDWRSAGRKTQKSKPGILDVLRSGEGFQPPSVSTLQGSSFDHMGIGRVQADAASLMADGALKKIIDLRRSEYDLIIVDGPSLHGAAETAMLAAFADKIFVAIKWGHTRRDLAGNAVDRLALVTPLHVRNDGRVGAVLTQIRMRSHARYRFGDSGEALYRI